MREQLVARHVRGRSFAEAVLDHAPHPLLTLQRLRTITAHTLLLATERLAAAGRFAAGFAVGQQHGGGPFHRTFVATARR